LGSEGDASVGIPYGTRAVVPGGGPCPYRGWTVTSGLCLPMPFMT